MATTSKLATTIDLSKLKAKELPTGAVKADFGNGEQEFAIHALNDLERFDLIDITNNPDNSLTRLSKIYIKLLAAGMDVLEGDENKARTLLMGATEEAMKVVAAISNLTNQFYNAKAEEKAEAEKN
jgi:D-arabinose 5-phosphate isomerase GutQ